jgi:hypothetical protein
MNEWTQCLHQRYAKMEAVHSSESISQTRQLLILAAVFFIGTSIRTLDPTHMFSNVISPVNVELKTNVSEIFLISITRVNDHNDGHSPHRPWWWRLTTSLKCWFLVKHWHGWLPAKILVVIHHESFKSFFLLTGTHGWLCGYQSSTDERCAKGWRDNHDLISHTSLYCMWCRAYTSELYRQLSSVDLTRTVYKTPHVTLRFQGFNQIISMDTGIIGVGMRLASLLWERVYPAVA